MGFLRKNSSENLSRKFEKLTWDTIAVGGSTKVLIVGLIVRGAGEAQSWIVELGGSGRGAGGQAAAGQVWGVSRGGRTIAPMRVTGTLKNKRKIFIKEIELV